MREITITLRTRDKELKLEDLEDEMSLYLLPLDVTIVGIEEHER